MKISVVKVRFEKVIGIGNDIAKENQRKNLKMINRKKINKIFFENVIGLLLSIYAFYLIVPSTLGDIIFVFFKKEASAEIIQISKNGTTRKPFIIKVEYFDNELVKDNIFTNLRGVKNLSQGQFVDVYYCNILERDTYLLKSAPGAFILFVQTLCFLGILIVILSCSQGIYNNFSN